MRTWLLSILSTIAFCTTLLEAYLLWASQQPPSPASGDNPGILFVWMFLPMQLLTVALASLLLWNWGGTQSRRESGEPARRRSGRLTAGAIVAAGSIFAGAILLVVSFGFPGAFWGQGVGLVWLPIELLCSIALLIVLWIR